MKICPNCGSVLADNEPYCENCGFDPSFDFGSWSSESHASSRKPYLHGDHIKSSPKSQDDDFDAIVGFLLLAFLALCFLAYLYTYNWDIVGLILSNLSSIFMLIICIIVIVYVFNFIDQFL